ncbi:hypothetical protein CIY_02150 [Butyrivibrio fibrisolvens 16/4]|nr:hypothetical protein CIY_02150 [Butyrivibrio fibrisolvens 16/4]
MTKNKKWIALFLAPGVLIFAYIFLTSIVVLLGTSFTDWAIGKDMSFVGLKNYITLFTEDKTYIESIKTHLFGLCFSLQFTYRLA